jgi:hypothetical protein
MSKYYIEFNPDQRREVINTQQRFQSLREARARARGYRGSMVWAKARGHEYLSRVGYDKRGLRRQSSLGHRSEETERVKAEFERGRDEARERLRDLEEVMARQAAVNRALGLGRAPLLAARILRALDENGLMEAASGSSGPTPSMLTKPQRAFISIRASRRPKTSTFSSIPARGSPSSRRRTSMLPRSSGFSGASTNPSGGPSGRSARSTAMAISSIWSIS